MPPAALPPPRRKTATAGAHGKARSRRTVQRTARARRPRPVAARPPATAAISLPRVECVSFEPQPAMIEPFAETMARLMEPAAVNEIKIQKLIQKRQRRIRRRRAEPAALSIAPEPASWLMMIGGFAVIGIGLRRRRMLVDRIAAARARPA